MAFQCDFCGKKPIVGGRELRTGTRGFLKKRIKRVFRPNLRWVKIKVRNEKALSRARICSKCLKRARKEERWQAERGLLILNTRLQSRPS